MFNLLSANIVIRPGKGGDGSKASSIQHRALIYHGGNGGNGGRIIFLYSDNLLINNEFKLNNIIAEDGQNGKTGKKDGKDGKDLVVKVSSHCIISSGETQEVLHTITKDNPIFIIDGGLGGYGSRMTKSNQFTKRNMGTKIMPQKLILYSILPQGEVHIFNTPDTNKIKEYILNSWMYAGSIDDHIICLNKNGKHIYIIPRCNLHTISNLNHISKIEKIYIYNEDINNPHYLTILNEYQNIETQEISL